jgi:hypothetical protein
MKKLVLVLPLLFLSYGFYSGIMLENTMQSILKKLDIKEDYAKDIIWGNCSGPSFYFPNPKDLKSIAGGEKAAIVKIVANYVKDYTATKEFNQKYLELRENRKPEYPKGPASMDSLKRIHKEQLTQSIADMEKQMKTLPADQKKTFEDVIKNMKQQLADIDDPQKTMYTTDMQNIYNQQYEQEMANYQNELKQWETDYPTDSRWIIKKWLSEFLDRTNDINFNAELINKNKTMVFVKPEYEQKDHLWKTCFRAGKEATVAGREFAQSWLNELK